MAAGSSQTLSHRERVRLALERRTTDRVPISQVCAGLTQPAHDALETYLQRTRGISVQQYLHPLVDVLWVNVPYVGPALSESTDIWGVHRTAVSYGPGCYHEIDHYPLADIHDVDGLRRHNWPRPEWFDYAALPDLLAAHRAAGDHALLVGNGNIFETAWYMRGFEQMLMDFVLAPQLAHAILERVTDFYVEYFRRILEAAGGQIDLVFTADDIGGQEGLLMSLEMWAEFIKPCHERMNRAIHQFPARVVYHSDGAVMAAVPGLIEMGIDVLQALQFDARGMDAVMLKEKYGAQLCFQGGVSVQKTLPFGSVADVRDEVRQRIKVLGRGGGYVFSPSHAVQAGTPAENIVAMFDAAATESMTE